MTGATGPVPNEMEVNTEDQVMEEVDVTTPATLSKLHLQVVDTVLKAMYPIYLFHDVDIRVLVDGHELTHGVFIGFY